MEEQAVGTWVDGKTIYRKSWVGTSSLPTAHGITGLDIPLAIEAFVFNNASGSTWRPIPWTFNAGAYDATWNGGVSISSTTFSWQLGTNLGVFNRNVVTLYYTKT